MRRGVWGEHLIRLCSSRRSDKPHSTNTTLDKTILAITLTTTTTTTISTTTTPIITQQLHLVQHQHRLCSTTRPSFFETNQPAGYVRAWLHCKKSKVTAVTRFMGGTKLGSACQKPRSRVGTADIRLWVCSVKSRSLIWPKDMGIERQTIQK